MSVSTFTQNMAASAVGQIVDCGFAYDCAETLGQGSAARFFLSVGETVERETGSTRAAERAMNAMAATMRLVSLAAKNHSISFEQLCDVVSFIAQRLRNNAARIFGAAA